MCLIRTVNSDACDTSLIRSFLELIVSLFLQSFDVNVSYMIVCKSDLTDFLRNFLYSVFRQP